MQDQYIDTTKMFRPGEPKKNWLVALLEKVFPNYVSYFRDNPQGYWFKRRLFGWGWFPVKWQGWLVVLIYVGALVTVFLQVDQDSHSVNNALIGILLPFTLLTGLMIIIGYWKGERPRWQWGLPKEYKGRNTESTHPSRR